MGQLYIKGECMSSMKSLVSEAGALHCSVYRRAWDKYLPPELKIELKQMAWDWINETDYRKSFFSDLRQDSEVIILLGISFWLISKKEQLNREHMQEILNTWDLEGSS